MSNLLVQTGRYEPGKRSYSYRLNIPGYLKIYRELGVVPPSDGQIARSIFGKLASGGESPEYVDKGDRRYHPVQNLKREIRQDLFSGWWDYDIDACAATLVHQYVVRADGCDLRSFPLVERMYLDKLALREELAQITGLDAASVKKLAAAIFFRGNPAPSPKAAIFRLLGHSYERHKDFTSSSLYKQLKAETRRLWALADQRDQFDRAKRKLFDAAPMTRRPLSKSLRRMAIYLSLERQVMASIESYLSSQDAPFVLMHDGFMSMVRVSCEAIAAAVERDTGFSIRLSEVEMGIDALVEEDIDVVNVMRDDVGEQDDSVQLASREASQSAIDLQG